MTDPPAAEWPHALIVAGPTCSGKSALALRIAEALGGVVINVDAMQIYRELRVLTARPSLGEEAMVPHRLYGVRPAAFPGSAAWWRGAALAEMAAARDAGRLPILCGGTGLYLSTLIQGIADIPDCGDAARAEARRMLAERGPVALHAALAEVDQATASGLHPTDGQRLARAWEVWRGTGRGLASWHQSCTHAAPWRFTALVLDPPREMLRQAITERFAAMLDQGAVDEVRALLALKLDPALPVMRAHGAPELAAHLRGQTTVAEATRRATLAIGQYTKRQGTWFRHHRMADVARTHTIHARFVNMTQFSECKWRDIIAFIQAAS
jgi:tRNA dimethylallyltransferase